MSTKETQRACGDLCSSVETRYVMSLCWSKPKADNYTRDLWQIKDVTELACSLTTACELSLYKTL